MTETPENRYGTTPYSPTDMNNIGDEPRSSRLTKRLVWVLMILHVVTGVIGVVAMQAEGPEAYLEAYLPPNEFQNMTPEMLDTVFGATLVVAIVMLAINVVLFVIVGLGLRANRNWARFMGLVLAILFLISSAYSLLFATDYGDQSGLMFFGTIINWVIVLGTIWWIIQALDKQTHRWFALHKSLQA